VTVALIHSDWHWFKGFGGGYHTVQVNIAPARVTASVALYGDSGEGASYAGIKHYRQRHQSGKDTDVEFGPLWFNWPPMVDHTISSATFALAEGDDQDGWLIARMDYWS
jgi:hypothetical protein